VNLSCFLACLGQADLRKGAQANVAALVADENAQHPAAVPSRNAKVQARCASDCVSAFCLECCDSAG